MRNRVDPVTGKRVNLYKRTFEERIADAQFINALRAPTLQDEGRLMSDPICGVCTEPLDERQFCKNPKCVAFVPRQDSTRAEEAAKGPQGPQRHAVYHDAVNHPAHYTSSPAKCSKCGHPIECIDVVESMTFNLGNAAKYIWRNGKKSGADAVTDLKKAAWYLAREIKNLGG
jgi:hypothetical protein